MEVAGLVLGVIPIAISAIDTYRSIFSSVKQAQRDLSWLRQDLETERIRLQNTCEILLVGIVPLSKIDDMISDPFGSDWRVYNDPLRLRLWTSWATFEAQVTSMKTAAQELRAKLKVGDNGQTPLRDKLSILRELKENASFSLKKDDYKDVMNQIKSANTALQELARQDYGLESHRRSRSQYRLIKLIRSLSQSMYSALVGALSCACAKSHILGLELAPRQAVILPTDIDDQVAKDFDFHFVLNSIERMSSQTVRRFRLRAGDFRKLPSPAPKTLPPSPTWEKGTSHVRWAKKAKIMFSESTSSSFSSKSFTSVTQMNSSSSTLVTVAPNSNDPEFSQIWDVCKDISQNMKDLPEVDRCYGYIADAQRRFGIYPPENLSYAGYKTLTLREVLEGDNAASVRPALNFPEKLKLAFSLCVNVLHLYDTPWLAKVVTLDEIVFFDDDNGNKSSVDGDRPQYYVPYRPFITKSADATIPWDSKGKGRANQRPINTTLLSLGALLVQIIIGQTFDGLDMTGATDMGAMLAKYEAGVELEDKVMEGGGPNYAAAVKWCFANFMGVGGFQNEKFCQSFYESVVARLQEDIEYLEEE
ncbi:hypothetical protein BX600DRAFT_514135 [Xylariales sp. PMI_506]|nr:hypothetical protein BX600DRAFT_514135 [Xylariales sp. PMI_506]